MSGRVTLDSVWGGSEFLTRTARAIGRSTIAIGEEIAARGSRNAHVISNNLRDSIHAAKVDTEGAVDAEVGNVAVPFGAMLEVGSWVEYACVEEVGRGHPFMAPAVSEMQGKPSDEIIKQAFDEEGLGGAV